jgi:hypothetical protein
MNRIALVLAACFLMEACATPALIRWSNERITPGRPVGVVEMDDDHVLLAYEFEAEPRNQHFGLEIPRDWKGMARRREASPVGEVESVTGLPSFRPIGDPGSTILPILRLHPDLVTGHAVPPVDLGRDVETASHAPPMLGYAVTTKERADEEIETHLIFAYDPVAYRWVHLADIELGPAARSSRRRTIGVLLFVSAIAADALLVASVVVIAVGPIFVGGAGVLRAFRDWRP